MLASLHDVKFIIDQNENLCRLCELVEPEGIYIVNEKKLLKLNTLDNLLKPVAGSC
jgi:hypothetical protein